MNEKILIVDDELAIREALGRKLRREGYEVILAEDGAAGLRAFHSERPSLVVLDIIMAGGMDGLTVCRRIRELADTPIMMLLSRVPCALASSSVMLASPVVAPPTAVVVLVPMSNIPTTPTSLKAWITGLLNWNINPKQYYTKPYSIIQKANNKPLIIKKL